jgi:hypothetical protein
MASQPSHISALAARAVLAEGSVFLELTDQHKLLMLAVLAPRASLAGFRVKAVCLRGLGPIGCQRPSYVRGGAPHIDGASTARAMVMWLTP